MFNYTAASKAMKRMFAGTGINSCKVTHQRTMALQYAGFMGLAPFQINTMTNHMLEKQHSAYQSVTERETCKVMAGFKREDEYFVPRSHIQLPYSVEWYCDRLLPDLTNWREQAATPGSGDKSLCCQNFLEELLPWFVEVLIQDGIYFIIDFPDHYLSNYLKVRMSL